MKGESGILFCSVNSAIYILYKEAKGYNAMKHVRS